MPATFKELPRQVGCHITRWAFTFLSEVRLWMEIVSKRKDVALNKLFPKQVGKKPYQNNPFFDPAVLAFTLGTVSIKTLIITVAAVQAGQLLSAKYIVLELCQLVCVSLNATIPRTFCHTCSLESPSPCFPNNMLLNQMSDDLSQCLLLKQKNMTHNRKTALKLPSR